jgi:hypothetical protein
MLVSAHASPQSVSPSAQECSSVTPSSAGTWSWSAQMPLAQIWFPRQRVPHPPQLAASLLVSTQISPQRTKPSSHVIPTLLIPSVAPAAGRPRPGGGADTHKPPRQTWRAAHLISQRPQCPADCMRSVSHVPSPSQSAKPEGHVCGSMHAPLWHVPLVPHGAPLPLGAVPGHVAAVPEQKPSSSQDPAAAVAHLTDDGANASAGQAVEVPSQTSATSQGPATARHSTPAAWASLAGQVALRPVQKASFSQDPAAAVAHLTDDGANASAGQVRLEPSQVSATSQGPAAGRHSVPTGAAANPHWLLTQLRT